VGFKFGKGTKQEKGFQKSRLLM